MKKKITLSFIIVITLLSAALFKVSAATTTATSSDAAATATVLEKLKILDDNLDKLIIKFIARVKCYASSSLTTAEIKECKSTFPGYTYTKSSSSSSSSSKKSSSSSKSSNSSNSGSSGSSNKGSNTIDGLTGNNSASSGSGGSTGSGGGEAGSSMGDSGYDSQSGSGDELGSGDQGAVGGTPTATDNEGCQAAQAKGVEWEQACALNGQTCPGGPNEPKCRQILTENVGYSKKGESSKLVNKTCSATRVSGLKKDMLVFLACLREECDKAMGEGKCKITINAGNDVGGHSTSKSNHYKGLAVDISKANAVLNQFIGLNAQYPRSLPGTNVKCDTHPNLGGGGTHWHCSPTGK